MAARFRRNAVPRVAVARSTALLRLGMLYLLVQIASYLALQSACSPMTRGRIWLYGALGPLAAFDAIPRLQYHSGIRTAVFFLTCLGILAAPFVYVVRPRLLTLLVSIVALIVWCLFGMGFTIHHM